MDKIVIIDFGGQYCHLISRRIKDFGIVSEILPPKTGADEIARDRTIKGIILSGGARSVYEKDPIRFDPKILELGLPVLGICYGHQLIAHTLGGKVLSGDAGEYGLTELKTTGRGNIFSGIPKKLRVWMNHRDIVVKLPCGFKTIGQTKDSAVAAYTNPKLKIFGVQFHPEVTHTESGATILENFVTGQCGCKRSITDKSLADGIIAETKQVLKESKAVIGLSGGVDSSVAAALVGRAIGKNLTAVYVDTGLMREGETEFIKRIFSNRVNLVVVDASKLFFDALKGIIDPERKRKIIGKLFVDVFYVHAKAARADYLIQGTIYSDRIESGLTENSSNIKSHHNVGGLPKDLKLKLYEPLRDLYKDEVRRLAKQISLPPEITNRQVFPGPGLAIRIIGEVTPERTAIVRAAHKIIEEELIDTTYWKSIWMSFAVLLTIKSVGIQGDERSYKYPLVLRIVESRDAMTANFSKLPYPLLEKISGRITNEIKEINRVVYDISNKPPATMEWE